MRGAARQKLQRVSVVAVAAALALALSLAPGVAFAESVEASPVITVPGSSMEGTVSVDGTVSVRLDPASVSALASAVASGVASSLSTASLGASVTLDADWVESRNIAVLGVYLMVGLLAVATAYRLGRG